ncbi:hypothetical protein Tco_1269184, partial [Tanacetum coccineum]
MGDGGIGGGDGVLKEKSSGVVGERVMKGDELSLELIEDEDVPLVEGILEGAFGELGCCFGDGVSAMIKWQVRRTFGILSLIVDLFLNDEFFTV